jgi:hypothetical protein
MNILCAFSVTMRMTLLAFVAGLAIGLVLGYRTSVDPPEQSRPPAAGASSPQATGAPTLGWSVRPH